MIPGDKNLYTIIRGS